MVAAFTQGEGCTLLALTTSEVSEAPAKKLRVTAVYDTGINTHYTPLAAAIATDRTLVRLH